MSIRRVPSLSPAVALLALVSLTVVVGCTQQSPMAAMCEAALYTVSALDDAQAVAAGTPDGESGKALDRADSALDRAEGLLNGVHDPDYQDELLSGLKGAVQDASRAVDGLRQADTVAASATIADVRVSMGQLLTPPLDSCLEP